MEVKVGIQHVNREIVVESAESASDVEQELLSSIAVGGDGVFTLTDERGRKVLIPASKIAYVDLGEENARHVGFGAGAYNCSLRSRRCSLGSRRLRRI